VSDASVSETVPLAQASLAERLGVFGPGDPVLVRRVVLALLAVYAFSFAIFYPEIVTNDDEAMYTRQALMAFSGKPTITQIDPFTGDPQELYPSTYAPGTALLMAPLVELFGWRAAFLIPCASLLLAVWLTFLWIRDAGHSPFFALVIFGFPPALVMGRVAMSDVPSAAIAALGMFLFWRGQDRHPGWWIGSGLVAGASWAFRATNPLLFVPLFAGTVLRRETRCWALIVGGLAGLGIRFAAMYVYFGSPTYERSAYHLALMTIMDRLPLYLIAFLVFVPAGLIFGCLYRGRRRPEIVGTILLIFFFFLFQHYSTQATSFLKRLVLALRYFIPLLPVLAFAMSEAVPSTLAALRARGGGARRFALGLGTASLVWLAGIGIAGAAVHPVFTAWSATQAEIKRIIGATLPADRPYVTNWMATRKFIDLFAQQYLRIDRDGVTPRQIQLLTKKYGELYIVLASRNDSAHWLQDGERSEEFLASLRHEPELLVDERPSPIDRLRIWRLEADSPLRR
jgi:hypothetical protein